MLFCVKADAPSVNAAAHIVTASLWTEDIKQISRRTQCLDLFHRAHNTERSVRIIRGKVGQCRCSHPAANARIDGNVLLAVRAGERDRVTDSPGDRYQCAFGL
jgi:hypothetical protein